MSIPRPERELLEKLCQKPQTLKRALEILRIAKTKTAPGSGHELKSNVGLPAICALIASDELNNGDVGRKEAQQASSMSQADFKRSHTTVQSVLKTVNPPKSTSDSSEYYKFLIKKTKSTVPVDIFLRWVERAERSLTLMQNQIDLDREDVQCAIFLWVYSLLLEEDPMTLDKFVRTHKLSSRQLERVRKLLETTSHSKQIMEELERVRQGLVPTPSTSPRKSPEKKRRVVPVGGSPQKGQDTDEKEAEPTDSPRKSARIAAGSSQKHQTKEETEPADPPAQSSATTAARNSPQKRQLDDDTDTEPTDTPTRKSARIAASVITQASPSKTSKRHLADVSPSKRVTRASDRIPPTTDSPQKRKRDEETLPDPESPSKRARATRSQLIASSSKAELIRLPPKTPTKSSLKGPSRTPSPQKRVRIAASVEDTPTKPTRRATQHLSKSQLMDVDEMGSEEEEEERKKPTRKRYRPVFVAFKQWNARDPRVEAQMKRAEKHYKDMVARYGHPFEHLRSVPTAAT